MIFEIGLTRFNGEFYGVLVECQHSYTRSELVEILRPRDEIVGIEEVVAALDECSGFYYISPTCGVYGSVQMDTSHGRLEIRHCTVVDLDQNRSILRS